MGKSLLRAVSIVLLLAGLLSATPALTQAPESAQGDQQHTGILLQSVTIPAAADAEVWSAWSGNYGGSSGFSVAFSQGTPSNNAGFSLVRFDLSSLPSGAIIDSAIMQLYLASVDHGSTLPVQTGAFFVNSGWSESTVTWSNRPPSASIGVGTQILAVGTWYSWGFTSFAVAWQSDPSSNFGVELRGPLSGPDYALRFTSREGGGNGPRLVVNYHMAPTTPTPTPQCWRLQGKVFDADHPGEAQPLQNIDLRLVGSNSPYPATGTQLKLESTNSEGWYGLTACDQPPSYNYYRIQLQVPTSWEVVNAKSVAGDVKGNQKVIEFDWPLQGQDLTGNKFWIRQTTGPTATATATPQIPEATPTPTATSPPLEGCENILSNGSFEGGIVSPWATTGGARPSSQHAHGGTKSVLVVEANDQLGELLGRLVLPEGADSITLRYWWRAETQDPEAQSDSMDVFAEPGGAFHHLAHHTAADDPGRWNLGEVDLSEHAGKDTILVFQARNGPSHPSKWYVDDVEIEVCGEGWGGYKLFIPLVMKGGNG